MNQPTKKGSTETHQVSSGSGGFRWTDYEEDTPELRTLLLEVIALFYTPTDLVIVQVLLTDAMTENELHERLKLELTIIRTRVQVLMKQKYLKIRQAGDANDAHVGMGQIYVNFSRIKETVTYILSQVRSRVAKDEQALTKQRKWCRMKTNFRCTNSNCVKHETLIRNLYAIQSVFKARDQIGFACPYCRKELEEISEIHPSIMTTAKFNETFGHLYELLRTVDDARLPENVRGPIVGKRKQDYRGYEVQVRIVDSVQPESIPVRKEIPEWFKFENRFTTFQIY